MDEFPRVHDFTEKTDRRSRGGGRMDDFNMYAVEKFANPSKIPSFDTIVRAELFLGLVSSPARYSNFVYDNSIREIIIFVTIVTKKKKKKIWRDSFTVILLDYPSRIKIVYTIWGNITYRNEETNTFQAKVVKAID